MSRGLAISLALGLLAVSAAIEETDADEKPTFVLPSEISDLIMSKAGVSGRCLGEYEIHVHPYYLLDSVDRRMWFLGSPDYLCDTNSFLSVIVDAEGNWTVGQMADSDWSGSRMLSGVPTYFRYSPDYGYFVASEWKIEGPANLMYHSADGVTWSQIDLPDAENKLSKSDCCSAPRVHRMCLDESGRLFVSYEESDVFLASIWSAPVADHAFPNDPQWSQVESLPSLHNCDGGYSRRFMPRFLREKTSEGALFDFTDWAVLIPGPTR